MCGRYVLVETEAGLEQIFVREQDLSRDEWQRLEQEGRVIERTPPIERPDYKPSYNIAPTTFNPIVTTDEEGRRQVEMARWGLIPFWWKEDTPPKFSSFNARDDKLTSGTWREPAKRSRCLVPANGFYEWTGPKGKRVPHFIHHPGSDGAPELFAFAGLADTWTNPESGEVVRSYAIITSEPNEIMKPIHNRMPVVLQDTETWALWLDPATTALEGVKHLLEPADWHGFNEYAVASLRGNGPELVEPARDESGTDDE